MLERITGFVHRRFSFKDAEFPLPLKLSLIGTFFMPLSLFAVELCLPVAAAVWLYQSFRKKIRIKLPLFYPYIIVFAILSAVSIIFSLDPASSLKLVKKFPVLLIPLMYYNIMENREQRYRFLDVLYVGAMVNVTWGLLMFLMNKQHRLSGFMGHYMTAAGILMLLVIILTAQLLTVGLERFRPYRLGILIYLFTGLMLTLTRNAWVGTFLGIILLFAILRLRYFPLGMIILFIAFLLLPPVVKQRVASTFDFRDETIQDRVKMAKTARNIIREYPLWGVGPEMIPRVYEEYKAEQKDEKRPHLHNNILHLAAERGLITLTSWLGILLSAVYYMTRLYNRNRNGQKKYDSDKYLSIGCIIAVISFLVAGLFEYNWGDVEVTILFLFLITMPFIPKNENGLQNQ